MKITLSPPAQLDLNEAADYYETSQPGLAEVFTEELASTLVRIESAPKSGSLYDKNTRYQMLHRFPYSVFYTEKNNEIVIVAIAHQHRKPGYWLGRVKDTKGNNIREQDAVYLANIMTIESLHNTLTEQEKVQLKLWASAATPAQRLAWLEEAQQIAYKSGALGRPPQQ